MGNLIAIDCGLHYHFANVNDTGGVGVGGDWLQIGEKFPRC